MEPTGLKLGVLKEGQPQERMVAKVLFHLGYLHLMMDKNYLLISAKKGQTLQEELGVVAVVAVHLSMTNLNL